MKAAHTTPILANNRISLPSASTSNPNSQRIKSPVILSDGSSPGFIGAEKMKFVAPWNSFIANACQAQSHIRAIVLAPN